MKNSILIAFTLLATVTAFGQEKGTTTKTNKFDLIVKTSQGEVLIDKTTLVQNEITDKIYCTYEDESINLDETVVIKTSNATLTGKYVMEKKDKYIYISFVYDQKETNSSTRVAETE